MKRSKSHQIDTQAQNILRSKLPADWVPREQHPDYGIDYEIEVNVLVGAMWMRVSAIDFSHMFETQNIEIMTPAELL